MAERATPRIDIFNPGVGMASIGIGMLALAAVQAVGMLVGTDRAPRTEAPPPEASLAAAAHAPLAWIPDAAEPQSAIGAGPGAPKSTGKSVPSASGSLVGLAANPIPNGTAIFRLWSSGRVEAMITTEENTWGEWIVVAPGLSTDMRRPRAPEDPDNPR